ncbi:MAG: ABC transporter permease [Clostridium sp.]|uniref:ABC transporter permease n=1 Tax=Clostridium sp. TaxID=1506 RepID=UPI003D6D8822
MELLKHELYKIFSKKGLYISLLVMSMVVFLPMILPLVNQVNRDFGSTKELQSYSKPYEGNVNNYKDVTAELLNKLQMYKGKDTIKSNIYNFIIGEYSFQGKPRMAAISDIMKKTKNTFVDKIGRINGGVHDFEAYELKDLDNNIKLLEIQDKVNTYEYKNKVLASNMYNKVSTPNVYYNEGWWRVIWIMSSLSPFLIVTMLLLGVSPTFAGEYESKVAPILLSTKNGRVKIMKTKILAAIIYTITVVSVVNLVGLTVIMFVFGIGGWNAPMQCLSDYICSPYNFTIIQFWLVAMLTSIVGYIIFTGVIILISNISKSSLTTFFLTAFVFSLPIIIEKLVVTSGSWTKVILNLSINQFMKGTKIYEVLYTVNVLGKPIIYPLFELGYGVVIIILLYFMIKNSITKKYSI